MDSRSYARVPMNPGLLTRPVIVALRKLSYDQSGHKRLQSVE